MLSVVMAGTNDNYGGEVYRDKEVAVPTPFKSRVKLCIFTLHKAFQDIDYEIVFVQWGPDLSQETLFEWDFLSHPRIRLITVPRDFASKVCPETYFHETHAKNVGIRRSRGNYILTTNPDIIWLDKFAPNNLSIDGVMIARRWNIYHRVLDLGLDLDAIREYCCDDNNRFDSDWGSNGDFTLMSTELWYQLEGLSTPKGNYIAMVDRWQVERAKQLTNKLYRYQYDLYHIRHPGRPLGVSYNETFTSPNFGFPEESFEEVSNWK
jgi:hypothetical protein